MPSQNLLARMISALYRQQMAHLNRQLLPYQLGGGSYVFLLQVRENPGITQNEISRKLWIDKGTTSKMLRILERQELITRSQNHADKRNNNLHVTPLGEELYLAISANVITPYRQEMLAGVTEEEYHTTFAVLEKIARNLSKL